MIQNNRLKLNFLNRTGLIRAAPVRKRFFDRLGCKRYQHLKMGCMMGALALIQPSLLADESAVPSAHDLVSQAEKSFAAQDFAAARDAYQSAAEILGTTPELTYNLGLTHYKLGEYDQARKYFQDALSTRDPSLESKAKYNLGNTSYVEALAATQPDPQAGVMPETQQAEQLLDQAIHHYGDALALNPEDQDARANIELAQRMIEQLKQQQQQQQQEQQQNQDQKQDQEQKNEEQNQQSQPQDSEQKEQNEQQEDSPQSQEPQEQPQEGSEEEQQQEQPNEPQPQENSEQQAQEQQQQEAKEISEQEAEKILQSVRDKERQRHDKKAKAQRAKRVPVAKDW